VSHLTPPRSFYVGEEFSDKSACDYFIPARPFGTTRAPIVVSRGSGLARHPAAVTWYVDIPGQGKVSLAISCRRPRATIVGDERGVRVRAPCSAKARMELEGAPSSSR